MLKKQYLKSKPVAKVTFSLPKAAVNGGKEVRLLGDFNDWNWEQGVPMKAKKEAFETTVELEAGRPYEFRYLIDAQQWENDWAADNYTTTPFGVENSVVVLESVVIAKPAKKAPAKKATTKKTTTTTTAKKATPAKKAAPKAATKKAGKDDLKKIEGIGPKIAQLLNADGIITFADLATAKKAKLQAVLDAAGSRFKMHDPSTWSKQAKLAAAGKMEELQKLQDELKGGRKK